MQSFARQAYPFTRRADLASDLAGQTLIMVTAFVQNLAPLHGRMTRYGVIETGCRPPRSVRASSCVAVSR